MDSEVKNGVIAVTPHPKDYISGGTSSCPFEELMPNGDWIAYVSEPHEMQVKYGKDFAMCTNFAATDAIEAIIFRKWGERVNFNERALAIMSNQTERGNSLWNVAETIRTKKLVPQELHPWEAKHDTFEKMMTATDEELADWKEASETFPYDIRWEWVYDDFGAGMREALKFAPLFVASLYASEGNIKNGIYCTDLPNSKETTHATVLLKQDEKEYKWVDDSYQTQIKCLEPNFRVPIGIRFHVAKKITEPIMPNLPKNSLVIVADTGERLMYVEGSEIYKDDHGKILLEVTARNAVDGRFGSYDIVHVMAKDIVHLKRINLKGETV
jgi:hypothetical protein